jgi:hypothetical protein
VEFVSLFLSFCEFFFLFWWGFLGGGGHEMRPFCFMDVNYGEFCLGCRRWNIEGVGGVWRGH